MIPKVIAIGLLAAVMGYVLSQLGFGGKRAFTALTFVIIIAFLGSGIKEMVYEISSFASAGGISESAAVALKVLFTGYVFGICSDVAAELSESGVANALTLAGRAETVLIVLPYLKETVKIAAEIIK